MHALICHDPSHPDASILWAGHNDPSLASFSSREPIILTETETCKLSSSALHWCTSHRFITSLSALIRAFVAAARRKLFPSNSPLSRHWLISFIADMSERKCEWICSENRIFRPTNWPTWWQSLTRWRTAGIWCPQPPWPWGRWKVREWNIVTSSWMMKTSVKVVISVARSLATAKCVSEGKLANDRSVSTSLWNLHNKNRKFPKKIICTFATQYSYSTRRLPIAGRSITNNLILSGAGDRVWLTDWWQTFVQVPFLVTRVTCLRKGAENF